MLPKDSAGPLTNRVDGRLTAGLQRSGKRQQGRGSGQGVEFQENDELHPNK